VTTIESNTFQNCGFTGSLVIPNLVTTIGANAFNGCVSLSALTLGNSLSSIGAYAFGGNDLRSIILPNALSSVGVAAFENNINLTTVYADLNAAFVDSTAFTTYMGPVVSVIYYQADRTGWTNPWNDIPTAEWTSYPDPMP
jgi:hypothetical protein